jgi:hypothetical protein
LACSSLQAAVNGNSTASTSANLWIIGGLSKKGMELDRDGKPSPFCGAVAVRKQGRA